MKARTTKSKSLSKTKSKDSESSDKKNEQSEFPGYPLYAAADDIMNRAERVDANLDSAKGSPQIERYTPSIDTDEEERQLKVIRPGKAKSSDSEVTDEDLKALGNSDLEMDGGDDEELSNRSTPVDFAGKDLDVPGAEDDDIQEGVGSEDEENNSYSIGGDDHNDLEEDKPEVN